MATFLKYIIEIHDSSGNLISYLENYYNASLTLKTNEPQTLVFSLRGDDVKKSDVKLPNELWLRDYKSGDIVRKFRPTRVHDVRS